MEMFEARMPQERYAVGLIQFRGGTNQPEALSEQNRGA